MIDHYYELLQRSGVSDTGPKERRAAYERARHALRQKLRAADPGVPDSIVGTEMASFDAAIQRLEKELADAASYNERAEADARRQLVGADGKIGRRLLFGGAGVIAILVVGSLAYAFLKPLGKRNPQFSAATTSQPAESDTRRPSTANNSGNAPLPLVFMRQVVYYRSTHPTGTVIIDKAQRFLYLTRPKVVAVRYGIGVGQECTDAVGLFRVTRKDERPPSPQAGGLQEALLKVGSGRSSIPLGARAMYLDSDIRLIHGTNVPESIGRSGWVGCFRLIDGDVIELYNQIAVGGRVVVMN